MSSPENPERFSDELRSSATTGRDRTPLGEELLRTYSEVVLATDAHNLRRCSGLSAGFAWVRDKLGVERSEDLGARADRVLSALLGRV